MVIQHQGMGIIYGHQELDQQADITGYGHTASCPGHSTCGVARTLAHCDTAVFPV